MTFLNITSTIKGPLKKTQAYRIYLAIVLGRRKRKNNREFIKDLKGRVKSNRFYEGMSSEQVNHWEGRIQTVLESEDNDKIKCVPKTGSMKKNLITMHNGLKIEALSYYGFPVLKMLTLNRTIHEPQEEFAFQTVLECMPKGATMIELGSFWSFYSMWFNKKVADARNFMLEPEHLEAGKVNFRLNKLNGEFFQYYVGESNSVAENGVRIICIDSFMKENNINFVDILHSDIQGYELAMLKGAQKALSTCSIGYIFISTHSNELHKDCADFLEKLNYHKVCSADLNETYSWDGLLVYKQRDYKGVEKIEISIRNAGCDSVLISKI